MGFLLRSDHVKMDSLPIEKRRGKKKKNLSARPEILIKLYNEPFPSQKLGA